MKRDAIILENFLSGRQLGKKVRMSINEQLKQNGKVVVDFKNVQNMSHSFADEAFGKLMLTMSMDDFKRSCQLKNVPESIKPLLKYVIASNLNSRKTASKV